jgi:hypothetical protein
MEKIMIVHHLALPQDAVDHICSFIFYTEKDVMLRTIDKYNIVIHECKHVRKEQMMTWGINIIPDYTIYFVLPRGNQLILAHICSNCGNYTIKMYRSKHIVCQCVF